MEETAVGGAEGSEVGVDCECARKKVRSLFRRESDTRDSIYADSTVCTGPTRFGMSVEELPDKEASPSPWFS